MTRTPARTLWLAMLLLAGSGFSALVYQVLWLRLLGLVFGVTVHAASTVLAAFMGGLAIGSYAGGRLADRVAAPLRLFGIVELLVAATALSTPALLAALQELYQHFHPAVADDPRALTLVRFAWSCAALLVPTTLMGATAPLVIAAVATRGSNFGTGAAALYAANTAGALAGAIITGYYLVGLLGISTSFRIAAALNLTVGVAALLWPAARAAARPARASGPITASPLGARMRGVVLGVAVVSGFVGLALEVIWFRTLVMFLPATTYVFTIILGVVLGGIATGSAVATAALRRGGDWVARLGLLQVSVAIAAVASLAAQGWTYAQGWRTGAALQAAALSVLPATLLMGAAFPVALSCWAAARPDAAAHAGARVGRFYLANLSGAIAGAVAAGFALIPSLGARRSLVLVSAVSLAAGIILLVASRRRPAAVGALLVFGVIAAVVPDPLDAVLARRYGGERVLWREEGAQATVSVHAGEHRAMYLDGLHQANDSPQMLAVHRQIGGLAVILHPDAGDALVVGLGGGATAGAVARFPVQVDVIELVPSVIRAAGWFRHATGDVLARPNVRIRVDDGRNYLLLARKPYDVITADIIQPFHAGAGNLYSIEYFNLAARTLREDGVMVQWIGNRPEAQYKLIARTFHRAFPHTTVWAGGTLLVGTRRELRLSETHYRRRFADPVFAAAAASAGVGSFGDLLSLYTASADELAQFIGDGPLLTDDRPMIEYFLSLPRDEREMPLADLRGDVGRHVVP